MYTNKKIQKVRKKDQIDARLSHWNDLLFIPICQQIFFI